MTEPLPTLEVSGLGKKLTSDLVESRRHGISDLVDEMRLAPPRDGDDLRDSEFWALRDVSFTVAPGEALGVVGYNGAGKSTLLRVLHGITKPDEGTVKVRGPHAAMLNLGAPFSKLLSGRENIVTAAALHGVRPEAVPELIDAVVAFSEMGDFLDAPMTTYSTGMQLRLGYGIAASLPTALLMVDEVIAVGDLGFQRKCLAHIRGHLSRGGSLVLVSHDLWMIQALCNRCLVLADGRVETDDTANGAISAYLRTARQGEVFVPRSHRTADPSEEDPAPLVASRIEVTSVAPTEGDTIRNGVDLAVELTADRDEGSRTLRWRLNVLTANRQVCLAAVDGDDQELEVSAEPRTIRVVLPALPLLPGTYYLGAQLLDPETGEEVSTITPPELIEVESRHNRLDTLAQLPGAGALSSVSTSYQTVDR